MNTDVMISLASDTHRQRLRDAGRERDASQAADRRHPSLAFTLGTAFVSLGRHLQGVTDALPEAPALANPRPVAPASR